MQRFSEAIKPRALDKSGSRKVFLQTAKRLLQSNSLPDLLAAVDNYAASERGTEQKFRKGFQTFFGQKLELYRDYLPGVYEAPPDPQDEAWAGKYAAMLESGELEEMEALANAV